MKRRTPSIGTRPYRPALRHLREKLGELYSRLEFRTLNMWVHYDVRIAFTDKNRRG